LKPDEFWRLTLTEFNDLVKGYEWRDEQEWQRIAQLAAWTINPHIKRSITADKLLNKKNKKDRKVIPIDEKRHELEELEAELAF
jgi:hypothetical protein